MRLAAAVVTDGQVAQLLSTANLAFGRKSWAGGFSKDKTVLEKKKDDSWCFCVDYRRLNAVTKKDSYPLSRIDDALEHISGSTWFSSLDLRSDYWQVELAPDARPKTAFTIGQGLWQFCVMLFGLCNAPATFERMLSHRQHCIVYLDDLLVHASDFKGALCNLREVFAAIRQAGLRLNPKKCQLFRRETAFLGHVVSADGVATDLAKIVAVRDWPPPPMSVTCEASWALPPTTAGTCRISPSSPVRFTA
ncbi:hypothetical protein AAFF_G00225910 [Aldrovandia affinis]|uniref:ribonuclease H n=1 Tax=Aldrovandia affinis TaxID=143900 RepID=A0AAD7X2G6_9TELE|nr:hypothetical protein AAFF_G00225910 [Aldrovandia affinis]